MLHSDQSCPDTPARLDSRTGIDPRKRKIENKCIKNSACWLVSSFFQVIVNILYLQTNKLQRHLQFGNIHLLTPTENHSELQEMKIDSHFMQQHFPQNGASFLCRYYIPTY